MGSLITLTTLTNPLLFNNYGFHEAKKTHEKSRRGRGRGRLTTVVRSGAKKGGGDDSGGVVQDMDGYLNDLSLEYDSVWDTKPSWCQPWTILLTGATVSGCSWAVLRSIPVTAIVSSLVCAWWYIFLVSYPKAYSDMIAERRKSMDTGVEVEDTFGVNKTQNIKFED